MDSKYEADKFSTASASSSSAAAAATVTTDVVGIRPKKKQKTAEGGRKITKARLAKEAATAAFEKSIWGGNHEKGMWFGVTNPAFGRPIWPGKPPEAIIGGHWPEADCVLVRDMKLVQLRHRLRYVPPRKRNLKDVAIALILIFCCYYSHQILGRERAFDHPPLSQGTRSARIQR
jgi:hypothetical protein